MRKTKTPAYPITLINTLIVVEWNMIKPLGSVIDALAFYFNSLSIF